MYDLSGSIASVVRNSFVLTAAATSDSTGIAPRESTCARACACALFLTTSAKVLPAQRSCVGRSKTSSNTFSVPFSFTHSPRPGSDCAH